MEFSTATTTMTNDRIGNDSLQFSKSNLVLPPSGCYEAADDNTLEFEHNQQQQHHHQHHHHQQQQQQQQTLPSSNNTNNHNNHHRDNDDDSKDAEQTIGDVTLTLENLLVRVESNDYPIVTATTSQSSFINEPCTKVSIISPVKDEDVNRNKDIVMLRNLEITPPPQELAVKSTPSPNTTGDIENSNSATRARRSSKRTQSEQSDESSVSSGRSKRQRRQTELFQAQSTQKTCSSARKQHLRPETPKIKQEEETKFQDVIFYEKGDHLAIRNEENTFYLCQLTENVRVQKPFVKVRWLDTNDEGATYFLTSHYDKVPQKSIIMPVTINKLKADKKSKQTFTIDDQIKHSILERLTRSLNIPTESEE